MDRRNRRTIMLQGSEGRGVMDELIQHLKSGDAFG